MGNFKVKDHYFHKAKNENYLARSIYKLEEIELNGNLILTTYRFFFYQDNEHNKLSDEFFSVPLLMINK